MKKVNGTLLLLLGIITSVFGQTYPVSLSTRIAKPYSIYLSDYTQPGTERMAATLLLRDANEPFYDVRLRVLIKGAGIQIESKPDFVTTPISLQTGLPLTLQNEDFAAYLNPQNLIFQGITRQQFERTGALPEGLYEISWQVYDFRRTEVSLSNQAITTAWIVLNNPPIINTPLAAEKLVPREPQNVRFSWQPGGALLNGGFTTEYRLELYEMREEGRDPNEIVRGTRPIATLNQMGTSLNFDASQITLIPGMQYAFRVQARDTEGRSLYKNSGYSEVRTFVYGDACLPPTEVTITENSTQWVSLAWQPSPTATQYVVRYRQAGPDARWFEDKTYTTSRRISGLRPGNTYEYQVKGQCGSFNSEYTKASTFQTIGADEANLEVACSPTALPAPVLDASTALPLAQPGSFFKVGHFNMKVTEVSGGSGVFSGRGELFVPFLATTLKVSFQSLAVNLEGQVVAGDVTADFVDERNLSVSTINRINGYQPEFSEICVVYDDEGFDKDGFNQDGFDRQGYDREGYNEEGRDQDGYDRAGFDEEGFDKKGFDQQGYDKQGFDQDGVNREGQDRHGNLVDPDRASSGGSGNTGSNGLSESVGDNALERVIKRHVKDRRDQLKDSVREQRGQVTSLSQSLEEAITDAITKHILTTRSSIVGPNDEATGEGMSEHIQITKEPAPDYPYYSVRKVHKDLYDADVRLQTSKTRQAVVERYRDDIATVATNLRTLMDALSTTKADSLKGNEDARNTWIRQQVDALIEEEVKPEGETFYYNVIPDVGAVKRNLQSEIPCHSDGYATLAPTLRPMVDPMVNRAFQLNQIIQDENRKRGQYAMEEARDLPVGISKVVGNTEFVVAIGGITFTPVAAYMDVYMGTEMPRSGHWLSFQAQAVEIFPEGFGGETNRLLLADDIPIRLSNAARLTLKGTEQRTFVEWDCQGFRRLGVQGEVEFCPGVISPAPVAKVAQSNGSNRPTLPTADGKVAQSNGSNRPTLPTADGKETVKARFETSFTDWDDFIAQITLDPFQVRGLNGFVFEVNQAYLDFSDVQNPTGMIFPEDYRSPYAEAGVAELWQGFYLKQAKVTLPQKLEATAGREKPQDLYVENMIIDDQGVSGIFSASGIIPDGSLGGWGYSVDRLSVHLVKNQLKGAEMLGGMQLPIMEDTLGYHARIQPGGNWLFAMSLRDTLEVPLWTADVHLLPGSTVVVEEQKDKFAAQAILNGSVEVNSKLLQNSVVRLSGLGFENLVVSTEVPHFQPGIWSLGEAGLGNQAAGFELTVTNVAFPR